MRGHHRDAFCVEEAVGPRFELALELLRSGRTFEFDEIGFRMDDQMTHCIVDSSCALEDVTAASAARDLEQGRATFQHLLERSPEFASAIGERPVRYELVHDYGNGSVLICWEQNGSITWSDGMP
jgi:hypothetical protein